MTTAALHSSGSLDFVAADRWPTRAAAHLLGAGLVIAVLVALPAAPTDLDRHQLPKETIVHLVTWLAVLLARPPLARGFRPATIWALALLLAVAVVSALAAPNGWLAFRAVALMITGMAALVTARHLSALGHSRVLLVWCAVAGVVGTATALAQAYGATSWAFASARAPGGTFGNRNFMAHFAALTVPLLLGAAITARTRIFVLAMIACSVLAGAIFLSRSRAAWIACGAGVALFAVMTLLARRRGETPDASRRLAFCGLMAAAGVVAALVIPNQLAWRSASPYTDTLTGLTAFDEGSGHGRVLQYRNTLRLALHHPWLGAGPGNWPVRYGETAPLNDPSWVWGDVIPLNPWPSSDWMALLSEYGFVAAAAVLLLAGSLAWRGISAARAGGTRAMAGHTLLALLTTLAIEGSFDAVLLLPTALLFVAIGVGALLHRCDPEPAAETAPDHRGSRATAVVAVALGVITLRSALQTGAYIVAGPGQSTTRLIWASRIDPGSYPIRIALAQRRSCESARNDIRAALAMAPKWPASVLAARRCGVRTR